MARIARVVVPGIPHHVIQRGNRRQQVFFNDKDRITYLAYLNKYAKPAGIRFWSYCLMDNHVHLIVVPVKEDSLARGFAEAHRRYTGLINFREGWRGYLWEGRFKSYPLNELHLYAALRYIEKNPVRAKLVKNAWDYPWSSARSHVFKHQDPLLDDSFIHSGIKDWQAFLCEDDAEPVIQAIEAHVGTGRPLGDDQFVEVVEGLTSRILHKQKPGPKCKERVGELSNVSP